MKAIVLVFLSFQDQNFGHLIVLTTDNALLVAYMSKQDESSFPTTISANTADHYMGGTPCLVDLVQVYSGGRISW